MLPFFRRLFDTDDFPARWHCGRWSSALGWLHILSDAAIFGAYAAIPVSLLYVIRKRRGDLPFPPVFWLFATFIFACGFGHLIEATIFWKPWYRLSGLVKLVTATASWATVIALTRALPEALKWPGLAKVNEQLAREVEERREVEQALRLSEERFALAVRGTSEGIWDWDMRSGELFYSERCLELIGLDRADLGTSFDQMFALVHPEDRQLVSEAQQAHIVERRPYDVEFRLASHRGLYRWYRSRGQAVWDAAGNVARMAGSLADITDRKLIEGERESLLDELQSLNADLENRVDARMSELTRALKEREILLQEIHHRVKNNLQVVSSLINMQSRRLQSEESRVAFAECQNRVSAIALIHEHLYRSQDYARIPFAEYAKHLAAAIFEASRVTPTEIALKVQIEDVTLPIDKAIPCGLILSELVTNALKHAFPYPRCGSVIIAMQTVENSGMLLSVSDDGIGLFPAFEARKTSSLGVQIVTTLVEQLEGTMQIVHHCGTKVLVEFPV